AVVRAGREPAHELAEVGFVPDEEERLALRVFASQPAQQGLGPEALSELFDLLEALRRPVHLRDDLSRLERAREGAREQAVVAHPEPDHPLRDLLDAPATVVG